jgi:hypothetical protein
VDEGGLEALAMRRLLLAGLIASSSLGAQSRVAGIAWDSLAGRPMAGAFLSIAGRSTTSDSSGRFTIDSVPAGTHGLVMQHDRLDSLGLPGFSMTVVVDGSQSPVRIATPSARTMWRRACGSEAPRDSGFVFGVIRDAGGRTPSADAAIVATWVDMTTNGTSISQKGWRLETKTSVDGGYVMCGLPVGTGVRLYTIRDSSAYAAIEILLASHASVQRHDLTLTSLVDSAARGVVRGVVSAEGQPVSNVRVVTDGVDEVRSSGNGTFILRGVPAGTRQLFIQGIGFAPTTRVVEVAAGDTTTVAITVGKVTLLDSVRVTAQTARTRLMDQFNDRRRTGLGYYRDSLQLGKFHGWSGVFTEMASVKIERVGAVVPKVSVNGCAPEVWIDRVQGDLEMLGAFRPEDIAALEIYRPGQIPGELQALGVGRGPPGRRGLPRPEKACAIWMLTKRGIR